DYYCSSYAGSNINWVF
nr:immunoglobulin light chain junction region [Macaca mulatta]MOX78076.1 immunoglobulin light chain junction region [Macaca mulatta]MOX78239.1 immunoglobulin light chain junction region [Macaca mulatta]MOX78344.1 immunoglobulin light chain junction region [Macaca mulatta]MOX78462.1 immunoglobulin light chain junction region [Macaca mulatta]